MPKIVRSALFKRQFLEMNDSYSKRADSSIAQKFVDHIEDSLAFIAEMPLACVVYTQFKGKKSANGA